MDGAMALAFLVAGLADMGLNHCRYDGCLAERPMLSRASLSFGNVIFQGNEVGKELYARYDLGKSYGPFQPIVGLSLSDQGTAWVGVGAAFTSTFAGGQIYTQLHLMPGVYARGNGPNLGHTVEFRSGFEAGYQAKNGVRVGLSFDHRSNAELSAVNPGLETWALKVSVPLKK